MNGSSDNPTEDYRKAGQLVTQAMSRPRLSPMERRLGHWLSAMVNVTEQKFERALNEAEAAINLSPNDAYMLGDLSQVPIMAGKPAQGLEWVERAASLDTNPPEDLDFYRGWALAIEGKLDESLAALKEDRRDDTIFSPLMKAIVLSRLGRTEEAQQELKRALAIDPKLTQAKWRELFFYSDPTIVEREVSDLASLGLPEK